ncbi:MFS general substrate transporter [Myriangium duriaei CBS 260.36]|uniref:MFS general substrate transporter n=1 Tax=Myriangium duriaei CBS 260.36 TaxID=1168546 RepID=A0A9P4J8R0_9PEZI|nr:MFS general substrate transporter [Myriangium duriaei CBS 260.36]
MPPHQENDRSHQRSEDERAPLLHGSEHDQEDGDPRQLLKYEDDDQENPRQWPKRRKMVNVFVIALMSIVSPLASSAFTPGIRQIAEDLSTSTDSVIASTTGFVICLGLGPLFLAPLSETFGRRKIYIICFGVFSLLQIPTALSPNIATFLAVRTIAGFFGSVGIANGGGTISDMFDPSERASVYGWYLLGPLLGPTIGPVFGGVTVMRLGWRWIFWIMTILSLTNTIAGYFFLRESYAPILLSRRKAKLEEEQGEPGKYKVDGLDESPLLNKLGRSLSRPIKIFVQPIVITMSIYQALIFGTTYSIYTNFQSIYEKEYGFNTEQVGLLYLGPGLGFLTAVRLLVPRIDSVYKSISAKHGGKSKPEYRLPLANIGAVAIPVSLFWFAWAVQAHVHWAVSIVATFFYGIGQVMILNTVQNYYIDSFEKYAASAIAAGAVFRSLVGGVVPLFTPSLIDAVGYGWGISVFAFMSLAIAPAPILFYTFGQRIRERFEIKL